MNPILAKLTRTNLVLAVVLLMALAIIHYVAYSLGNAQGNPDFRFDIKLALLFVLYYLTWIAVIIANFYLMSRYIPVYGNRFLLVFFIAGAAIWIPIATYIDGTLTDLIYGKDIRLFFQVLVDVNPISYFNKFMTYCFVFGAIAVLVYYRLYQNIQLTLLEREKEAAEAKFTAVQQQLTALHSQLAPHFLFNCLNMLSGLARMGQRNQLVFAIARLGDMLRFVSEASREGTILLDEEIEFVKNYVQLQKARFGDKYIFDLRIRGDTAGITCPPFCLHTLVENAYTHSVPSVETPTSICVSVDTLTSLVRIVVENNNLVKRDSGKLGIGLKNLNDRLELLYGDAYILISDRKTDRFVATMDIPI